MDMFQATGKAVKWERVKSKREIDSGLSEGKLKVLDFLLRLM